MTEETGAAFLSPPRLVPKPPHSRRVLPVRRAAMPSMLSKAAISLLRNARNGRASPINPSLVGVPRLPRSFNLYLDTQTRMAVVLCPKKHKLSQRHADSVLAVVNPLLTSSLVDSFVISVSADHHVDSAVHRSILRKGGELVVHDGARIRGFGNRAEIGLDHPNLSAETPSKQGHRLGPESTFRRGSTSSLRHGEASTSTIPSLPDTARMALTSGNSSNSSDSSVHPRHAESRRRDPKKRMRRRFELCAEHAPAGDQPKAIEFLTKGLLERGKQFQTLHGVTGSGKTFMMANIIANANCPTLILAPNKTLAAQLCNEFSRYFPKNRVEFFVSHFKFYQPEAYLPNSDKYIAKASAVDHEIDRLRHAATKSLFERNDTIVVASVSSIYGLGLPTEYLEGSIDVQVGDCLEVEKLVEKIRALNYLEDENKVRTTRGFFSVASSTVEVSPPWEQEGSVYRYIFEDGFVAKLEFADTVENTTRDLGDELVLYPAKHFVTPKHRLESAIRNIEEETKACVKRFVQEGKLLEASRLEERVNTDIEMMRKVGFCQGAENYSLYLSGRDKSTPPETLLDYMPRDGKWLLFVDESHVTVPQLGAMHAGNAARKRKLIRHGFRLPSAMENRPLNPKEFWSKTHQTIFVSATPGPYELDRSGTTGLVEAVIRPTAVVDPTVEVVATRGQIEHLTIQLAKVAAEGGKAIVTTITKKFAEDVADCLSRKPAVDGILDRRLNVSFLHSGIDSVGRMHVLEAMRDESGDFDSGEAKECLGRLDVVVGVNLLREGIDLPAVRLVAILDADSEGFLRGETALIQTIGRAARNVNGHVIMFADTVTTAMQRAISETNRRRRLQVAYNSMYNVTPAPVGGIETTPGVGENESLLNRIRKLKLKDGDRLGQKRSSSSTDLKSVFDRHASEGNSCEPDLSDIEAIRTRMLEAAESCDFETAALLRDHLRVVVGADLPPLNRKQGWHRT